MHGDSLAAPALPYSTPCFRYPEGECSIDHWDNGPASRLTFFFVLFHCLYVLLVFVSTTVVFVCFLYFFVVFMQLHALCIFLLTSQYILFLLKGLLSSKNCM